MTQDSAIVQAETPEGGDPLAPPPVIPSAGSDGREPPSGKGTVTFQARRTEAGVFVCMEGRADDGGAMMIGDEIDDATARQWLEELERAVGSAYTRTMRQG